MKKAIVFLFTTICFSSVFAYPESEILKDMEKSKRCAFAARIVLQTLNPSPVTQEEHRKRWGALWLELRQEKICENIFLLRKKLRQHRLPFRLQLKILNIRV